MATLRMICRKLPLVSMSRVSRPACTISPTSRSFSSLPQGNGIFNKTNRLVQSCSSLSIAQKNGSKNFSSAAAASSKSEAKKSKTAGDIFLDNIGTVFLSAIGLLILTLIRSSRGTTNKNTLRNSLEIEAALDPFEINDLRTANEQFTPEVFKEIFLTIRQKHGWTLSQKVNYESFVSAVLHAMRNMKGDTFTIGLGHLMDRVVVALQRSQDEEVNEMGEDGLEFILLLVALSLAVNGPVVDRVQMLYDISNDKGIDSMESADFDCKAPAVVEKDIIKMIGYLQQTCQLVPDAQIVESDVKYPAQNYRIGSPAELVFLGKEMKKEELNESVFEGEEREWTCDDFHHLLRSKSVCAWGECYVKKKGLH